MISLISYYADLAIGLVLAFLLLSLLVSGINEGLVRLLGIRSKFLWAYLRDTLDGAETSSRTSAALRALDRLLHGLKGLGHRLRAPLMELLPSPREGRSRLPATVLGVFAKLPFGRDPRPFFSPRPPPVASPPLAPAPDSVAAQRMAAGPDDLAHLAEQADGVEFVPGGREPVLFPEDPVEDPAHLADQADAAEFGQAAAQVFASSPVLGDAGSPAEEDDGASARFAADAAHFAADAAHFAADAAHSASDAAHLASGAARPVADRAAADPAPASVPQVVPPGHGKSMAELLYERLQEIDHSKRGKTSIADIPPARFAVALMEIATEHGGVGALLRDLDSLHSPLSRPLKAVLDKTSGDLEAFRKGVEEWFDGEMTRLSLLYRRYVRWVLVALGLVVTLAFSMDALEYGKTLLTDNAYRSEVTAFAQSGPDALAPLRAQCAAGQDPYTCVTDVLSTPAFVKIFTHAPVSVTMGGDGAPVWAWRGSDWWERLSSPGHWPGYLITLMALLFGAPFWWDILRRISGIRSRPPGGG